jgi:hypothetical protein
MAHQFREGILPMRRIKKTNDQQISKVMHFNSFTRNPTLRNTILIHYQDEIT